MAAELLKTVTALPPGEIDVGDRLRPVSEAGVAALKASIAQLGGVMKDPVHVRKRRDGTFVLLAGAHRLTAAREMGWETIPVTAWKCNDDFAAMMEIDDNLASAELTALDTAVFLAARKTLYQKIHPEMAQGGFRGNQHTGNLVSDIVSFTTASAEKFGLSKRHIERLVKVGEALDTNEVKVLREAQKPVGVTDLMTLSKIGEAAVRNQVVLKLAGGNARNAKAAWAEVKAEAGQGNPSKDPVDVETEMLRNAWSRARLSVRRSFIEALLPDDGTYNPERDALLEALLNE